MKAQLFHRAPFLSLPNKARHFACYKKREKPEWKLSEKMTADKCIIHWFLAIEWNPEILLIPSGTENEAMLESLTVILLSFFCSFCIAGDLRHHSHVIDSVFASAAGSLLEVSCSVVLFSWILERIRQSAEIFHIVQLIYTSFFGLISHHSMTLELLAAGSLNPIFPITNCNSFLGQKLGHVNQNVWFVKVGIVLFTCQQWYTVNGQQKLETNLLNTLRLYDML